MPASQPAPQAEDQLDELALRVLEFERVWAARVGAKEAAIRSEFSIPAARYYQMLYALIDSPVALRSDPLLVRRLQRLPEILWPFDQQICLRYAHRDGSRIFSRTTAARHMQQIERLRNAAFEKGLVRGRIEQHDQTIRGAETLPEAD